jgi:hypothetical protein
MVAGWENTGSEIAVGTLRTAERDAEIKAQRIVAAQIVGICSHSPYFLTFP